MNTTQFANYFIGVFVVLLLFNYFFCNYLSNRFGWTGFLSGLFITLIIDTLAFYLLSRVKVEDKDGKPQKLADLIVNTFSIGLVSAIISGVFIVITTALLARSYKHGLVVSFTIPTLTTGIIFASIAFVGKVLNK